MAKSARKYVEENESMMILDLSVDPVCGLTGSQITDVKCLQTWIKNSNLFMNTITNSGSTSPPRSENWENKTLSPYGNKHTKKQKHDHTLKSNHSLNNENISLGQDREGIVISPSTQVISNHIAPTLKRAQGILTIGNLSLDKSKLKGWLKEQVRMVLLDTDVGVGLDEEDIQNTTLKGFQLEIVVDALYFFNGDVEAKIEHAVAKFPISNWDAKVAVVRWVFKNLLEFSL